MNKHKYFISFFTAKWFYVLPAIVAWSLSAHWMWADVAFWQCFWACINSWMIWRTFDTLQELWTRTELLRDEDEES